MSKAYRIIKNSNLFNAEWYQEKYLNDLKVDPIKHYLTKGYKIGYDPSNDFSTNYYLNTYTDVKAKGMNPLVHYEILGKSEGRRPINEHVKIIQQSEYFDEQWYARKYNLDKTVNFAEHYLNVGYKQGYNPSEIFYTNTYLELNKDVLKSGINPLLHYELSGKSENRLIEQEEITIIRKSSYFDEDFYKKIYLDDDKMIDPAKHYFENGVRLHYNPSTYFSTDLYLMYNQDIKNAGINPLYHFEKYGKYEVPTRKIVGVYNMNKHTNMDLYNCKYVTDKKLANRVKKPQINKHVETVDIIVCVHNALDDVKLCLNSVKEHTSKPYRIIIVNDNSGLETSDYLKEFADTNEDVILVNNDTNNHGYTYAANIGLKKSSAKYNIMLDSDTIVTDKWVDKMIDCAKSDNNIGVVGPLSNTASWQSVPNLLDENGDWNHNTLPENLSIDMLAELIEKNSNYIYPKVPLINGFCMMITRETIEKTGYFDEENFASGFGEDNDYNYRVKKLGIDLAICDSAYVYHAKSKKHTDENRLSSYKDSCSTLAKKYGQEYIDECCGHMQNDIVLSSIRCRAQMYENAYNSIQNGKIEFNGKSILFLLPVPSACGGANIVINESQCMKKMGVNVAILNFKRFKDTFQKSYPNLDIPVTYVDSLDEILKYAEKYSAVCCTHNSSVKHCDFSKLSNAPKLAYYIQGYEPKCYEEKSPQYKEAKASYTLFDDCINFTKTNWTRNIVKSETGANCKIIGASTNLKLFFPSVKSNKFDKIKITALMRPGEKWRSPKMTFKVLRCLKNKYRDKIDIKIFGCDVENKIIDSEFFNNTNLDFKFTNYGILTTYEVADLLSDTDIFIDLSEHQAMGLTAMEAMASGCATIVPSYGGATDFAKDEENALVVNTLDYNENIKAVQRLIEDKKLMTKLSLNACNDMCKYYQEKVAYNILKEILKD